MIIEPSEACDEFNNSGEDQSDNEDSKSLEEQEQLNSENLSQRIEEENEPGNELNEETPEQMTPGEEAMSSFFERTNEIPDDNLFPDDDRPLTRNLLGDNPPGSESASFESGNVGDASAAQFKYDEENLIEGFRENLDKTEQQINLDKKLKDDLTD
ncbi:hypothetical protein WG906_18005 [Pedobacter sp. P351]|uniref:hypothetical protein n=1 Tax=Pedobacter superstes TaxID=3133441 RepID=UPI0030A4193A